LKVGKVLTAQELDALRAAAALDDAKMAIYAALSRRAHSRKELAQKLQRKGFSKDIIDLALAQAEQHGFINDQAFAQSFIQKRLRQTPLGVRKLQVELHQKGVSRQTAQHALTQADLQRTHSAAQLPKKSGSPCKKSLTPKNAAANSLTFFCAAALSGKQLSALPLRCFVLVNSRP
jgi:Uncharacterized protein conserved in bacteria